MSKVNLIFVYPHTDTLKDSIVGEVVELVEGGKPETGKLYPVHVGGFILGGILEALKDGVVVTMNRNKYLDDKTELVNINIPDMLSATIAAKRYVGDDYSFFGSCYAGAVHDLLKMIIHIRHKKGEDCSEVWTEILRAGGINILPGIPAYCVTPKDLYIALLSLGGKIIEKP